MGGGKALGVEKGVRNGELAGGLGEYDMEPGC